MESNWDDEEMFICDHASICNNSGSDCVHKIAHEHNINCQLSYCGMVQENVRCISKADSMDGLQYDWLKRDHSISILLKGKDTWITFIGVYVRELEKPNWHYYKDNEGTLYHFRKDEMQLVKDVKLHPNWNEGAQ